MINNAEELVIEQITSEDEDKEIGVPLYKIISYPADYTVEGLYLKMTRDELIIPKFQRRPVWSHAQMSKLIESFLMGLPVPGVFLYKEASQRHLIVDGQQRLLTVRAFFDGQLPDGRDFSLKGVDPKWEGKRYVDLDEEERIRLRVSILRAVIIEQLDPEDNTSVYHIYERLNTGGTSLNPQEVRNSLYHGPFNNLIVNLNEDSTWRTIFGLETPDARMRDVELIVRFLALLEGSAAYSKPMKTFLNTFMGKHQWETERQPHESIFLETVRRVKESLGPRPFHIKRGINVAVFDSVMVAFARSRRTPDDIAQRFEELKKNPSYIEATSSATTDDETVKSRIRLAQQMLSGHVS